MYPESYRYTKEHEWIEVDADGAAKVGITQHAQGELGDIVFVELPETGKDFAAEASFGVVESVKAVSDLYMPVAGKVTEVNQALEATPELINQDPHGEGWILKLELADAGSLEALMDAQAYKAFVEGL